MDKDKDSNASVKATNHRDRKKFFCNWCEMRFTTSGELTRHVRYKHTHEKPHKCTECDYSSVELSKLRRHMRSHTGERPFQCPHCTFASPDSYQLKRHLRKHTGDQPYECEICHSRFTQSNSLKAHRMVHNVGEKPEFQCPICSKTCGRKTDLRKHMQRLHHSEKPIPCKICGSELADRYNHKLHMKTHNGERCYRCDMCPYAATTRHNLGIHNRRHANEKPIDTPSDEDFRHQLTNVSTITTSTEIAEKDYVSEDKQGDEFIEYVGDSLETEDTFVKYEIMETDGDFKHKLQNVSTITTSTEIDEEDFMSEDTRGDEFIEYVGDSLTTEDTFVKYEIMATDEDFKHQLTNVSTITTSTETVQAPNTYTSFHMEYREDNDAAAKCNILKEEKEDDVFPVEKIDGGVEQYMIVKVLQSDKEESSDEDLAHMDNIEVIELPAEPARKAYNINSFECVYENRNDLEDSY